MGVTYQVMDQVGKQRESNKEGLKGANFDKRKYLQQSFMGEGLMPLLGNQNCLHVNRHALMSEWEKSEVCMQLGL